MGNCKQDRLYMCNAFVQPLLPWKSDKCYTFWECVCSLKLSSTQRVFSITYCHLWPSRLYNIFPHYLIKGTIFGKRLLNITRILIFFTTFAWNISLSKKNTKFSENPSSRSRVVPRERTDRQTDMMTLRVAFQNFANAPIGRK